MIALRCEECAHTPDASSSSSEGDRCNENGCRGLFREEPDLCPESEDGEHRLDPNIAEACKEIPPGGWEGKTVLVDVWCKACGRSGATRITLDQVDW